MEFEANKNTIEEFESKHILGLLDLPVELLGVIFGKYLDHQSLMNIRQANSYIQVLLDEYIGYNIVLDEKDLTKKLEFVSEVAVRNICVLNMTQIQDNEISKFPMFKEMLQYPQCLKEFHLKGNLDVHLFSEIIRKCPIIEILQMGMKSSLINGDSFLEADIKTLNQLVLPEVDIKFLNNATQRYLPRCRALRILLKEEDNFLGRKLNCEAVLTLLKSVQSCFLERVVLQCKITKEYSIARSDLIAAQCLERNPSIRYFFYGILFEGEDEEEGRGVETESVDLHLQQLTMEILREAGLTSKITNFGIATKSSYLPLWKQFIQRNHYLVHVSFTVDIFHHSFSREMFSACQDTLEQFVHRGKYHSSFDFECFQDCHKLKEICLHNTLPSESSHEPTLVHTKNLILIPNTVESLILFQMLSKTHEIIQTIDRLKKLESLVLYKTGNSAGETGINPLCIKKILSKRNIQSVLLVRFVASSTAEAVELIDMMQAMNRLNEDNPFVNVNFGAMDDEDIPPLEDILMEHPINHNLNGAAAILAAIHDVNENGIVQEEADLSDSTNEDESSPQPLPVLLNENLCYQENSETSNSDVTNFADTVNLDLNKIPKVEDRPYEENILEPGFKIDLNHSNSRTDGMMEYEELLGACGGYSPNDNLILKTNPVKYNNDEQIGLVVNGEESSKLELSTILKDNEEEWSSNSDSVGDAEASESDTDTENELGDAADIFDFDLEVGLNLQILERADQAADQNFQLVVNLQNEGDLQEMLGVLGPFAQGDNNNIFIGFVLDGVVDISDPNRKNNLSSWTADVNDVGNLTYNLKINCMD